jgi:heme-degrading monooxygenase HmoA
MSCYLVYICQAVKNRAGLERYWQVAQYPKNIAVLAGYAPFEVLDADQDERVEGVVLAEFPPFEQTVEWFNGEAYVQARKNREGNEYLGMLVESGVTPISKRKPRVQTD